MNWAYLRGGVHLEGFERPYLGVSPALFAGPLDRQHVVGEVLAEAQLGAILGFRFQLIGRRKCDPKL